MKKDNFINSIIFCLYKYYDNDLFKTRIAFCTYLLLFFYPIIFYIDKTFRLGITIFMMKLNFLTSLLFIAGPLFFIVLFSTINKTEIELIKDNEAEILRKRGKNNFLIILAIILFMWTFRIIEYLLYKT